MTLWLRQFPVPANRIERDSSLIMRSLDTEVPTSLIVLVEPLTENAVGHVDEIAQTLFNELQYALIEGARTKTFSIELAIQNLSLIHI